MAFLFYGTLLILALCLYGNRLCCVKINDGDDDVDVDVPGPSGFKCGLR